MAETDQGVIFNIQKFSLNDGPGIRTVVFFKGCPLHCRWCANPESQLVKVQIAHDRKKCVECRHCMDVCSEKAVSFKDGRITIDHSLCNACGKCVAECPASALSTEGHTDTVEEIVRICKQDEVFYEESGGGVTLSGGEMLMQPDFAVSLLKKLKEAGIHTACETTGFASRDTFARVIENIDYVLMDCKHWNCEKHMEYTGVPNDIILSNMKYAISIGKEVLPRIPVIPGFNDSLEDAGELARVLKEAGAARVQLLPFHQFGENKYDLLSMNYAYTDTPAYHKEDLAEYAEQFKTEGIEAFF